MKNNLLSSYKYMSDQRVKKKKILFLFQYIYIDFLLEGGGYKNREADKRPREAPK